MPESAAIERVRKAMGAWTLCKGLPEDFDQLRADLQHILDCIPESHTVTNLPPGITATHNTVGTLPDTSIVYNCQHCGWSLHALHPDTYRQTLQEHSETHTNPWGKHEDPWTLHIPEGIVLGADTTAGIRLHCAHCEWDAVYSCLDLRSAVRAAIDHTKTH